MTRSKWKPDFAVLTPASVENIRNTSSVITLNFIGKRVYIYTGRTLFSIIMRDYMLGHRFGQYFRTKKFGDFHPQSIKRRRSRRHKTVEKKGFGSFNKSRKVKKAKKKSSKKSSKR